MRNTQKAALAAILVMIPAITASTGGWAVITVRDLPDYLEAGVPTDLSFSVRQHGMSVLHDLEPVVEARSGRESVRVPAKPGKKGQYRAALTVPASGDWTIRIQSGFYNANVTLLPIQTVARGMQPMRALQPAERGRRLFVAKGCLTCHTHARVENSGAVELGPDLSIPRLTADYLARVLDDPSILPRRGDIRMPNLGLTSDEIAALVAFLAPDADR